LIGEADRAVHKVHFGMCGDHPSNRDIGGVA
jgi:hypothetical protein